MAVNPVNIFANAAMPKASSGTGAAGQVQADFGDMVAGAIKNVAANQKKAEAMTINAAQGGNVPIQDVIQAVGEAEMTLQTMLTVRDRAVEAYQEIQRMPI